MAASVAVGKGGTYRVVDHSHSFATPKKGQRRVLAKEESPIWTPPDWHYYEKAESRGLEVVALEDGDRISLSDGTGLELRERSRVPSGRSRMLSARPSSTSGTAT